MKVVCVVSAKTDVAYVMPFTDTGKLLLEIRLWAYAVAEEVSCKQMSSVFANKVAHGCYLAWSTYEKQLFPIVEPGADFLKRFL